MRYRGLKKNANRLFATCALVNLYLVRKKLHARQPLKPACDGRSALGAGFSPPQARQTGVSPRIA